MFKHFWRGIFRGLLRRKLHSLINIASLALGLAVFAFALLYVKQELSYDRGWPEGERVHRMLAEQHGLPGSPDGVLASLRSRVYPALTGSFANQIDKISRMYTIGVRRTDLTGELTPEFYSNIALVEPDFADMFRPEVLSGSMEAALQEPGFIAVEESYAARFAEPLTVGSRLTLVSNTSMNGQWGLGATYEVAAIFRSPGRVSQPVNFQLITLMHDFSTPLYPPVATTPWNNSHVIWLTFAPGMNAAEFEAQMPAFIDREISFTNTNLPPGERISQHLQYRFQPLTEMYFDPLNAERGGDFGRVLTIGAIGVLVLLVGCSNSVSLSLASVLERRREIGIRKAAGAQNTDVLVHYLGESMLLAVLALIPALLLVTVLTGPFTALLNIREALSLGVGDYLAMFGVALLVGLASGAWPGFVLAAVKPQSVLKMDAVGSGRGTQGVRTLIVGFQFCFALMLLIGTLALFTQLAVLRAQPLGFRLDNRMFVALNSDAEKAAGVALMNELRNIPGVTEVVAGRPPDFYSTSAAPTSTYTLVSKRDAITEVKVEVFSMAPGQFAFHDIPLLAGRDYDAARDVLSPGQNPRYSDQPEGTPYEGRLIVNRSAVRALGYDSPEEAAGQLIWQQFAGPTGTVSESPARIIGVVEDNMYSSLRRVPGPTMYFSMIGPVFGMLVAYDDAVADTIQEDINALWQRTAGVRPGYMMFMEPQLASAFDAERNESRLLLYCAGLALFLSSIGLYGLAAFTMERRVKEVGIRKALGAGQGAITGLFLWRYARPVLLASIVAIPVAMYFVLQWLERFPYQMDKAWLLPLSLGGTALVLAIALLTVTGVVLKAARARPVLALRYE